MRNPRRERCLSAITLSKWLVVSRCLSAGLAFVCDLGSRIAGSPRWPRDLTALTRELASQAAVGYLQLNDIVQGQEIVLEGMESDEASGSREALNEHVLGDRWPEADERREMLEEAVEVIRLL